MAWHFWKRIAVVAFLCTAAVLPASAQYTGGGTGSGGGYGNGAAIGAGVGAAVGGAALIYWATHRQSTLVGCVQSGDGGMRIIDERSHQTYSLVSAGDTLKPGERVKIQGKKVKDSSGAGNFRVSKVVQELGACEGVASLGGQSSATRP